MGENTKIEWTDRTFNGWVGCTKVSPGCANCYAERLNSRWGHSNWGPGAPRRPTSVQNWKEPLRWARKAAAAGKRAKVFTASLADIFDAEAPVEKRRELWQLIRKTWEWLDWQVVTKRASRVRLVMEDDNLEPDFFLKYRAWLIVSTENQATFDERVPYLLEIPAAVHGISAEPLLGKIDASKYIDRLQWIITGGESQHGARPMHPDWSRSLRDQAVAAGVPFFFKQWGEFIEVGEGVRHAVIDVKKHAPPIDSKNKIISIDGHVPRSVEEMRENTKYRWVTQIGTKNSGSTLDGQEWKQFPLVA